MTRGLILTLGAVLLILAMTILGILAAASPGRCADTPSFARPALLDVARHYYPPQP